LDKVGSIVETLAPEMKKDDVVTELMALLQDGSESQTVIVDAFSATCEPGENNKVSCTFDPRY